MLFHGCCLVNALVDISQKVVHGFAYRKLVVHGFAVDEEGHKMAKSVGNVVDPAQIINGFSVRNSNIHKICK